MGIGDSIRQYKSGSVCSGSAHSKKSWARAQAQPNYILLNQLRHGPQIRMSFRMSSSGSLEMKKS